MLLVCQIINICNYEVLFGLICQKLVTCKYYPNSENWCNVIQQIKRSRLIYTSQLLPTILCKTAQYKNLNKMLVFDKFTVLPIQLANCISLIYGKKST